MYRRQALIALTALAFTPATTAVGADTIVVGGKNFTEQLIMASLTSQLLKAKGYSVETRTGLGSATLRQAQESGQVDVYWEYTGTALITYDKIDKKLDAAETYATVKKLDAAKGLVWLDPSKANNTYALAMRQADADAKGIHTISELAAKINGGDKMRLGSTAEFYARPDGLMPMEKLYGFEFGRSNVVRMDAGLIYQALRDSQIEVGVVFATDGRIPAFHFTVLKDDKDFFPTYAMTPVVRKATLDKDPKLAGILNALSAKLDDEVMAKLNASVDVEKKGVDQVAADFLKSQGLI
ncbi:MAG: glycine betaine ABC transporter substrate-binding protein [Acetobacteraceae bacterium]